MKVYVSLTSIYDNQSALLSTLKSISSQTTKPDKCFLYLSENAYLLDKGFKNRELNTDLHGFLSRNDLFEIKWCDNIGPYRKLLPLLKEKWDEDCVIITIDDDTVYDPTLIENYVHDYDQYQCCISYRGFTMYFRTSLKEIVYTKHDVLNHKYLYNFHTGKGGVAYHPRFFRKTGQLIFDRGLYTHCCETGDDVWFNFLRISNNVECYVKDQKYVISDHSTSLSLYNNFNMKNDLNTKNIQKTITKLMELSVLKDIGYTFDSNSYWENRYKNKGNSGDGSYGDKALFKGN